VAESATLCATCARAAVDSTSDAQRALRAHLFMSSRQRRASGARNRPTRSLGQGAVSRESASASPRQRSTIAIVAEEARGLERDRAREPLGAALGLGLAPLGPRKNCWIFSE
jgi:hypothetical protein